MTVTIAQTIGVDISKLTLDVYLHPQATTRQFPNTTAGINDLLAWLGQTAVHRVIFEPTGAYDRILERQLGNAGVPMIKVNPLQARRFAKAIGQRAKTDAVDAAMLARFGALDALRTRPIISQTLSDIRSCLSPGEVWSKTELQRPTAITSTARPCSSDWPTRDCGRLSGRSSPATPNCALCAGLLPEMI